MLALYSCSTCGKKVLIVEDGKGTLVCCGNPMTRLDEKSVEAGREKHLPVIEKTPRGIRVKVGAVSHPMEKEHFIRWIEVIGDTFLHTAMLAPGEKPEKEFCLEGSDPISHVKKVRIYCNVHGVWAAKP
ncbi:desulfoferrodoxin [uncultured Methanoregula sp.]|uniref:desulfoferrodoxin n=1 Tax=uncultured Methanoregula sp. TaxID=1005933 RepID=UPI002AAB26D3|nr:desulfoferrodoxin [uncultured Methanoregula sp.]